MHANEHNIIRYGESDFDIVALIKGDTQYSRLCRSTRCLVDNFQLGFLPLAGRKLATRNTPSRCYFPSASRTSYLIEYYREEPLRSVVAFSSASPWDTALK